MGGNPQSYAQQAQKRKMDPTARHRKCCKHCLQNLNQLRHGHRRPMESNWVRQRAAATGDELDLAPSAIKESKGARHQVSKE